jgi:hypothetical protein
MLEVLFILSCSEILTNRIWTVGIPFKYEMNQADPYGVVVKTRTISRKKSWSEHRSSFYCSGQAKMLFNQGFDLLPDRWYQK